MKKHIELNEKDSSYIGTATCYFGDASWNKQDETFKDAFLSISDCYNTIRLHPNTNRFDNEEMRKFKDKLKRLEDFIRDFRTELPDNIP